MDGWIVVGRGRWGLRTVGLILLVHIECRDRQTVGYRECTGVACPWSAGDIVCVDVDVVLMVERRNRWVSGRVRVASGVHCGRRGGRDRRGGGEGGESARAGHGGGGRWGDGAFIMCIYRMYQSKQPGKAPPKKGFYPQPWGSIGLTQSP